MVDASVFSNLTRGPEGRRRAAILVGSVALHAGVLALIGLGLFETRLTVAPADDRPIFIQMEPRPLLEGETARLPSPSRTQATETRPQTGAQSEFVAPLKLDEDEGASSPPAPRAAAGGGSGPAAPGSAAAANPWSYTPESQRAAVARTMRTGAGGCRIMDGHLSASEQALCDDNFNERAGRAGPLGPRSLTPNEQRREAEFARQGAQNLARYEAQRRPLSGGVGVVGPAECAGSNFGTGCAGAHLPSVRGVDMHQGADSLIRQPSNKVETP